MGGYIAQCLVSLLETKFGNSSQKASANRYHTFLVLPSFSGFLYFIPNILFGIAAPRRRCLGYSKVYCDVKKGGYWHGIKTDILHIPVRLHLPLYVCWHFIRQSFWRHYGLRTPTFQILESFHFHAVLLTRFA